MAARRECFAGQTNFNLDAKIADEGRPQGGEGTHKGCPYLLFPAKKPASSRQRRMEFAIAHYDLHSSRRYALRRAPTRGAPTRFRQPHVVLSQFDAIALECFGAPLMARRVRFVRTEDYAAEFCIRSAKARMCGSPMPQHPPTSCTPWSIHDMARSAKTCGSIISTNCQWGIVK